MKIVKVSMNHGPIREILGRVKNLPFHAIFSFIFRMEGDTSRTCMSAFSEPSNYIDLTETIVLSQIVRLSCLKNK